MSLKTFHILFVCVCVVLALGFAAWCFGRYGNDGGVGYGIAAAMSLLAVGGLVYYGVSFLRKLKDVSFF